MYIAMNRFKVRPEDQEAFKKRWLERNVYLKTVPGFVSFHLLQGITSSTPPIPYGVLMPISKCGHDLNSSAPPMPVLAPAGR